VLLYAGRFAEAREVLIGARRARRRRSLLEPVVLRTRAAVRAAFASATRREARGARDVHPRHVPAEGDESRTRISAVLSDVELAYCSRRRRLDLGGRRLRRERGDWALLHAEAPLAPRALSAARADRQLAEAPRRDGSLSCTSGRSFSRAPIRPERSSAARVPGIPRSERR